MFEARVIQSEHGIIKAGYQFIEHNYVSGGAAIDCNMFGAPIHFEYAGNKYCLKYDHNAGIRFYRIFDEYGQHLGTMERREEKGKLFQNGYRYTEVNMAGKKYHIYAVGMGKEGIHYPCHLQLGNGEERQIGLICKNPVVYDYKDVYDCYMTDEADKLLLLMFTVYNDFWAFRKTGSVAKNTKETKYVITTNKKLKAKCDPEFLKR